MIPKWTPVSVDWLDAHTVYDNTNSAEIIRDYKKAIRHTIGWLIHYDRERIVIAMDDDRDCPNDENDIQTTTTIPRAMIIGEPIIYTRVRKKNKHR